ncbi:MAG: TolC family protein [Cycloclasticus sp.]
MKLDNQTIKINCFLVKRWINVVIILVSLNTGVLQAQEITSQSQLTEIKAVELAVRDNPNLAQMKERYKAMSEVPSQVGSLPDPMVSFNAMNFPTDTFSRSQEPMTQLQIGVSQAFPFPGKLRLKEAAAQFDAMGAGHLLDEVRLQLIKKVKSHWWQLYYLDRAIEIIAVNKSLVGQFITVAKTKYETGQGLQQDVLLSQLELSKLLDQEIKVKAIRRNEAIRLNILMGQAANETLLLFSQVSKKLPSLAKEHKLYEVAELKRPVLKQAQVDIKGAKTRLNLAKREYYPDFTLGVTYGDRTGDNPAFVGGSRADFLSLMMGVKIPLYASSKQAKAVNQKSYELQKTRYQLTDQKAAVRGEISSALTDYQQAKEQFSLFGTGIVPQAQQTVKSMLAGYQVSEVDFLNLIRSQITLFNYELQYWKAFTDAKQALARIEAATGEEVNDE